VPAIATDGKGFAGLAQGLTVFLAAIALLLSVSPARSEPKESETKSAAVSRAVSSKTLFYRLLARKPAATIEDAIRAVARFKGGSEELQPLAGELAFLESHGVSFPKDIARRKDETLTIGSAAHMLMKAMGIKGGGLMYKFFSGNQRYAMREAVSLGIVQSNSFVGQTMSGNDLVGMLVLVNEVSEAQKRAVEKK